MIWDLAILTLLDSRLSPKQMCSFQTASSVQHNVTFIHTASDHHKTAKQENFLCLDICAKVSRSVCFVPLQKIITSRHVLASLCISSSSTSTCCPPGEAHSPRSAPESPRTLPQRMKEGQDHIPSWAVCWVCRGLGRPAAKLPTLSVPLGCRRHPDTVHLVGR